jgi:hypothetical protein
MRPRTSARIAVVGIALGAPAVAFGLALDLDPIVGLGALSTVAGAVALTRHAGVVQRERGPWTTDPGWHRITSWSLVLGPAWFALAIALAGGRFIVGGADPAAWDVGAVAAALGVGWIAQVLVGSWSHLLPAIGPGDPVAHARQREILGRAATGRVVALNAGVALATVGALSTASSVGVAGLVVCGVTLAASLIAFGAAARIGLAGPGHRGLRPRPSN